MANLGSEFLRVVSAHEKNNREALLGAVKRCFGIIDALLAEPKSKSQKEEILILKKVLEDFGGEKRNYSIKRKEIESYFNPFARRIMSATV